MSDFSLSFLSNQFINIDNNADLIKVLDGNNKALLDLLDGLSNGETILGKVVSSDKDFYSVQTQDNILISAKSEDNVLLETGKNVLFEVRKNSSGISLRPLNINTSAQETVTFALKQAGIPINERSMEFVIRNMEFGNPIDKHSLIEGYKDVVNNPLTPVKYIVDLQKIDIPRTEENISMYKAYLNMENSISEGFLGIIDDISTALSESAMDMIENLQNTDAEGLLNDRLSGLISELENTLSSENITNENSVSDVVKNLESSIKAYLGKENISNGNATNSFNKLLDFESDSADKVDFLNVSKDYFDGKILNKDMVLREIKPLIKNIMAQAVKNNWALNAEDIPQKENIKALYDKLFSDTKNLLKVLEDAAPKESLVANSVQNMNSNIDFMNALNNFIPYVQIPFAGDEGVKSGELYVLKNKHSMSSKDTELTAFIHLDTKNLGATDVFVKLRDVNVSTHFTFEKPEYLDFIEMNMPFLDKRLSEKGYKLSMSGEVSHEKISPVEQVLSNSIMRFSVVRQSFDARV